MLAQCEKTDAGGRTRDHFIRSEELSYTYLLIHIGHTPSRPISTYTRSSCRSTSTVHVCHSRIRSPPQGGSVSGTAMTRTSMWAFRGLYEEQRGAEEELREYSGNRTRTTRLVSVPPNTAGNRTPSDGWSLYLQARKGLITYQCMIHGKRSVPGIELRDLLLDVQVLFQLS